MKSSFSLGQKAVMLLFAAALIAKPLYAQMFYLTHGGVERSYEVVLPQNFEPNMPLVIALHGCCGGTNQVMKDYTGIDQFSDTAGFVLVLPNGIDHLWNIGLSNCPIRGTFPTADDVGFISTLINKLYIDYEIDLERVYCCGWSTGGEMALRLGIELGYKLAAVASVAGGLYDRANRWSPKRAMPVLEIHGTDDQYSMYYGPDANHSQEQWSIEKTLDYWVDMNQCDPKSDTLAIPDLTPEDACIVEKITFSGSPESVEIVHFKITKGGHAWPGAPSQYPYWPGEINRNRDINANQEIWNFFKKYANPEAPDFVLGDLPEIETNFNIYPNPAKATLYIEILNSAIGETVVEIFDLRGNIILSNKFNVHKEHQAEQINVSSINEGLYILKMLQYNKVAIKRIVVIK